MIEAMRGIVQDRKIREITGDGRYERLGAGGMSEFENVRVDRR